MSKRFNKFILLVMPFSDKIKKLRKSNDLNQAEMAEKLGIVRQTIINWEKGNTQPEREDLKKLSRVFDIDLNSLLEEAEEGGKVVTLENAGKVPFYDVYAVAGHAMLADQDPITDPVEYVNPGDFLKKATGTLRVYGHSGFPKYPAGSIVAFKETKSNTIHYGEDYVIEVEDRRIIKRVQKSKRDGYIQLNSYNTMKDDTGSLVYAPYEIALTDIRRMNMVLGLVILEASI
jgi:transcriptional regulator with XRE-family HTH domain